MTTQTGEKYGARIGQVLGEVLTSTDPAAAERFGDVAGGGLDGGRHPPEGTRCLKR